jgi:N,N'-diacetyllegionaminate synthase
MKLLGKDLKKEILYIAEIGVNHEGSIPRCLKLIKEAKQAGADVVKFQCFTPEQYVSKDIQKYKTIQKFFFNQKIFDKIIKFCKKIKIKYLFTPVSHDWINYIKKNSNTIKVASGDLNFNFLINQIVKKKFNIILSTGTSSFEEIQKTFKIIKLKYGKQIFKKLVIMHCVSRYPVPDEDANLLSIVFLKNKFNLTIGYSNHVIGINACLASICMGARVIEFHFTDNKKRKFRDHQLSLDKSDVIKMIKVGNNYNRLIGKYKKIVNKKVLLDKKIFSKGIIANKNLDIGHKIKIGDLSFARPAKYFHANEVEKILNKKIKTKIKFGSLIKKSIFK